MAKQSSRHQQKIIRNYYENREAISLQKLQEQVTELYLSEGKKRERYWKTIVGHLEKLGIRQAQIDHVVQQDDPALVARIVEQLMEQQ